MNLPVSFRFRVALMLLLFSALAPAFRLLVSEAGKFYRQEGVDGITDYENSLSGIKDSLPLDGVIGYVTDKDDGGREFYLLQYSLAPRHVVKEDGMSFFMGSFSSSDERGQQRHRLLIGKEGRLTVFEKKSPE